MSRDKYVSVEFAYWIQTHCFYNIKGYMIAGTIDDHIDSNEYQVDELFDYWYDNIFKDEFDKISKQ